ncbi:hypothetical protein FOJ82_13465 [Tessaracoccus rhinocerotis]|uniref:Uncharacterized protein n=1 Tax=Tessaracoccus rhinocerotis TaxID=1689449 RepID=A0A553JWR0_9ACTN|nr:hypothetical protein [Tessaracoccus rhinocerotis]TRY16876.1 hypothetical protein FOJ82_13465 [Tessaracoccus rhinocerotis]
MTEGSDELAPEDPTPEQAALTRLMDTVAQLIRHPIERTGSGLDYVEAVMRTKEYFLGLISHGMDPAALTSTGVRTKLRNVLTDLARAKTSRERREDRYVAGDLVGISAEEAFLSDVPEILVEVAIRTLQVSIERDSTPQLKHPAGLVVRLYLELEHRIEIMTDEDWEIVRNFPDQRQFWRKDLADHLGRRPNFISDTTGAADSLMRLGIYLFIVLAPPQAAVVKHGVMNKLLDLVHKAGPLIPTDGRRLMQRAGELLAFARGRYPIPQAQLIESARALQNLAQATDEAIISALHNAEALYAVHVPHQHQHAPQFLCVERCSEHLPVEEG